MRTPGGPDGAAESRVPRRAAKFWSPLNTWWRSYLAEKGRRPVTSDVQVWYDGHAATAWGEGRPSWKEARIHAKCLRSTEQVKNYFREYRARSKVGCRAVSTTSVEGAGAGSGSAGDGSGDYRSLDMRRGTSLSILVPGDSGRLHEFASPASSSRARSLQPGSARAASGSAAAAAAAEPSNLGVLIAAHNARIARMGSFGGGSSASASPASHNPHAPSDFTHTPTSSLDTGFSLPPDVPPHHTPSAVPTDTIFSALNPSTVTTGGGLPSSWASQGGPSKSTIVKHEFSRFHSLHAFNFGVKDSPTTAPSCDRSMSFGSGSYPTSTSALPLQQLSNSFRSDLDAQRSLRAERAISRPPRPEDSSMGDLPQPPMRTLDNANSPEVHNFSGCTQLHSVDIKPQPVEEQQQQVPGATVLAWCSSAALDRSSAAHTVTTTTPRTYSLPSELAAPMGRRGSMQVPLFDDSPFSSGGTAAFLAAAHPFLPPSSSHHTNASPAASAHLARPLFSDSSAARVQPTHGPPLFSTSASLGDARAPFPSAPWSSARASLEASASCSASARAVFAQPGGPAPDRPTWAGSLQPAAPAAEEAAASDRAPAAFWALADGGTGAGAGAVRARGGRRASMQDHAPDAGCRPPPSLRSNSMGYDQAAALSLHAAQLMELRSASFPRSGQPPDQLGLQFHAAAAPRKAALPGHGKPPVPGLPRCTSRSGTNSPEEPFCRYPWDFVGEGAVVAPAPGPDPAACQEQQLLADTVSAEISYLDFNDIVQQRQAELQACEGTPGYEQQQGYQAKVEASEQRYAIRGVDTAQFGYVQQQQYQPGDDPAAPPEDNLPPLTFQSLRVDSMRRGDDALPQQAEQQWGGVAEAMEWSGKYSSFQ